jgi:hypothetical protein
MLDEVNEMARRSEAARRAAELNSDEYRAAFDLASLKTRRRHLRGFAP